MKTIIHVNQHNIKHNTKHQDNLPVITAKNSRNNRYGHTVEILDKNGEVVATVQYSPFKPLACGAKVWIETTTEVRVMDLQGNVIENSNVPSRKNA